MNKIKLFLGSIYNILASMSPLTAAVGGAFSLGLAYFTYGDTLWSHLFSKVDALVIVAFPQMSFSPLGLANYFFPLDTALTCLATWCAAYLASVVVRVVKSFIPFING